MIKQDVLNKVLNKKITQAKLLHVNGIEFEFDDKSKLSLTMDCIDLAFKKWGLRANLVESPIKSQMIALKDKVQPNFDLKDLKDGADWCVYYYDKKGNIGFGISKKGELLRTKDLEYCNCGECPKPWLEGWNVSSVNDIRALLMYKNYTPLIKETLQKENLLLV